MSGAHEIPGAIGTWVRPPLPKVALSVRQPWAWAIVYFDKDVENRSWKANHPGSPFRGEFCVHASQGMTKAEYETGAATIAALGGTCPAPALLLRGGIIGVARVTDFVRESPSSWFSGPRALTLADRRPVPFVPAGGMLGFFQWETMPADEVPQPAKWMQNWGKASAPPPAQPEFPDLLGLLERQR